MINSLYSQLTYLEDESYMKFNKVMEEIATNKGIVVKIRRAEDKDPWDLASIHN